MEVALETESGSRKRPTMMSRVTDVDLSPSRDRPQVLPGAKLHASAHLLERGFDSRVHDREVLVPGPKTESGSLWSPHTSAPTTSSQSVLSYDGFLTPQKV